MQYSLVSLTRQTKDNNIYHRAEYVMGDPIEWVNKQNDLLINGYEVMAIIEISKEEYERNV